MEDNGLALLFNPLDYSVLSETAPSTKAFFRAWRDVASFREEKVAGISAGEISGTVDDSESIEVFDSNGQTDRISHSPK